MIKKYCYRQQQRSKIGGFKWVRRVVSRMRPCSSQRLIGTGGKVSGHEIRPFARCERCKQCKKNAIIMTRYSVVFLFCIIWIDGLVIFGQTNDYILTHSQNKIWFDSLKVISKDKQIDYIRHRMLKDTCVYNTNYLRTDRIIIDNENKSQKLKDKGNLAEGRIIYIFRYKHRFFDKYDFVHFQWHNWTSSSKIKDLCDFLSNDKISNIEIDNDYDKEIAIWGTTSGFGVIIFDLNKKRYIKAFNTINKK